MTDPKQKIDEYLTRAECLAREAIQRQRGLIEQVRTSRITMKVMLISKLEAAEVELVALFEMITVIRGLLAHGHEGGVA